jgi:7,8-dihydropterin-6-yl-methyl-4-(beta-D-ribofuranosyl)aminobenzene 5'-phosphate synthase
LVRLEEFGETRDVAVTVLVDNRADLIVKSTETVKRFRGKPLLAEHGFAALIDLKDAGIRILWDAGITTIVLMENVKRIEVDLSTVDKIALSHGHGDHTAAMTQVIRAVSERPSSREWEADAPMDEILAWVQGRRVPLVAHPAAFRERWHIDKDGKKHGPGTPAPRAEWEAAGAEVILSEGPYRLGPGCWTTGAVPRHSFEKAGISGGRFYRDGGTFERDRVEDDQAIVIHVEDKGLVIVAGCAHSGIVNTVNCAREISGVEKVWAVLGGFHLAPASEEEIERTIDEIEKFAPTMIVPTHCSGFKAISRFAERMPDAFVQGVVGTTYLF